VEEKINFSQIAALIVDADHYSTNILSQILRGFSLLRHNIVENADGAKLLLQKDHYDLVICEAVLPDMRAAEFVRWTRMQSEPALKLIPVVMLTGYTQFSNVTAARDGGADSVARRPWRRRRSSIIWCSRRTPNSPSSKPRDMPDRADALSTQSRSAARTDAKRINRQKHNRP